MSATTMTDRYVWAVSRQLPAETGPDVARELRVTLAEAVEDRVAAGADPDEAERAAVAELGDPDVLAREYGGRPDHLIGPSLYPSWVRLAKLLLTVVLPIAVAATVGLQLLTDDRSVWAVLGSGAGLAVNLVVHLLFWSALVFAVVERHGSPAERDSLVSEWGPDDLADPDAPWRRAGFLDLAGDVVFGVAVTLLVLWQLAGVGAHGVQVLDPDLAPGWKVVVVGLLVAEVAVTVGVWALGRWSIPLSVLHALINAVLAVVLVLLLVRGVLLTDLPQVLGQKFGWETDWSISTSAVAAGIIIVCGWDVATSLVRVARGVRARRFGQGLEGQ